MSLFDAYSRYRICSIDGHLNYRLGDTELYMCDNDCCYCNECGSVGEE